MLTIKHLTIKDLKNHILLEDFSFSLGDGDKVAVVGEEGNGKSTLLKAIYNQQLIENYTSISGSIDMDFKHIGYLEQQLSSIWDDEDVMDYLLKETPDEDIAWETYNELAQIEKICVDLQIPLRLLETKQMIKTLSGGEKVKLQLLKLIHKQCDFLLLDEPTNDLDITTLTWLEAFLLRLQVPAMFISHDEILLKHCANRILHMEQLNKKTKCRIQDERMGYAEYASSRKIKLSKETQVARKEKQEYEKKKERLNDIMNAVHDAQNSISRQDPHHAQLLKKKMRAVKAMNRRFDKEGYTHVDSVEEAIDVYFEGCKGISTKVILDDIVEVKIDDRMLIEPTLLQVYGQDKVVIIGDNGCGKTQLMKQLYTKLKIRDDLRIGYMPQHYYDLVEHNETPTNFLLESGDANDVSYSRVLLGRMKFTSEEMIKPIASLSEGQKAKLYLLRFIKLKCNVLLLDEPTRNLSPLSAPVIRDILSAYDGCIIAVSHDRLFIDEVAMRIIEIRNNKMEEKIL